MKRAKENPSYTKQVGGHDARKMHPGKDKSHREHPHKIGGPGQGYRNVGKPSKQGGEDPRKCCPHTDKSNRNHPHQGR